MSALAAAPDLAITPLEDDAAASLQALRATAPGKARVIDFWTTKCERCPACLQKLDKLAAGALGQKVTFA